MKGRPTVHSCPLGCSAGWMNVPVARVVAPRVHVDNALQVDSRCSVAASKILFEHGILEPLTHKQAHGFRSDIERKSAIRVEVLSATVPAGLVQRQPRNGAGRDKVPMLTRQ